MSNRLTTFIRAGVPIMRVQTTDEARALRLIRAACAEANVTYHEWNVVDGCDEVPDTKGYPGVPAILQHARDKADSDHLFALLDFHKYMNDASVVRLLRCCAHDMKERGVYLVLVNPPSDLPADLHDDVVTVDVGMPDREELRALLRGTVEGTDIEVNGGESDLLDAAAGLTAVQAENAYCMSIVERSALDAEFIAATKADAAKASGVLEFIETNGEVEAGGLGALKRWLELRAATYTDEAKEYGLRPARGVLLVGPPGCGKSLFARVVKQTFAKPLLRLDVSRLHSHLLGGSEQNIRKALDVAEAVAPCILWVDEIEKAFGGTGTGEGHEASVRVLGHLLTWMQEHSAPVFVFATANDVTKLPPELLRKGRFDEVFAFDLPDDAERAEIARIHLAKRDFDVADFDLEAIADGTVGFSGAEIEASIVEAMHEAFYADADLCTEHVLNAAAQIVPLSVTAEEQLSALRAWADRRARPAGTPRNAKPKQTKAKTKTTGRRIKRAVGKGE